jgi:hypothetical protein
MTPEQRERIEYMASDSPKWHQYGPRDIAAMAALLAAYDATRVDAERLDWLEMRDCRIYRKPSGQGGNMLVWIEVDLTDMSYFPACPAASLRQAIDDARRTRASATGAPHREDST